MSDTSAANGAPSPATQERTPDQIVAEYNDGISEIMEESHELFERMINPVVLFDVWREGRDGLDGHFTEEEQGTLMEMLENLVSFFTDFFSNEENREGLRTALIEERGEAFGNALFSVFETQMDAATQAMEREAEAGAAAVTRPADRSAARGR